MATKVGKPAGKGRGKFKSSLKGWLGSFMKLLKENALPALLGVAIAAAVSVAMNDQPNGSPGIVKLLIAAALPAVASMFLGKFITKDVAVRASGWALGLLWAWKSLVGTLMTLPVVSTVITQAQSLGSKLNKTPGTSGWSNTAGNGRVLQGSWTGQGVNGFPIYANAA